jgi:GT2 family glycosyltransferase
MIGSDVFVVAGNNASRLEAKSRIDGLVSIVVSCCGQLEYSRLCLPSLLRHSRQPCDLICLDCDSMDGTAEYLEGIAGAASVRVEVVRVPAEPQVGGGRKDDVVPIRGDFVALVNNDIIVTHGWLERLLALLASDADIGMVAPTANHAPALLAVDPIPYEIDLDGWAGAADVHPAAAAKPAIGHLLAQIDKVDSFARAVAEQNHGQWVEMEQLAGGCVVLKRAVLQRLGMFPSRTPLGTFDTEALSDRVRSAGYRLAGGREAYVHNFASRRAVRL